MDNFISKGKTVDWTNGGSAVASGAVVIIGDLVGIAATAIAAGAVGAVWIEGVFEVACNADDVITQGQELDWDASALEFVDAIGSAATGDNENGVIAMTDAGATVSTVHVKLLPGQGATT